MSRQRLVYTTIAITVAIVAVIQCEIDSQKPGYVFTTATPAPLCLPEGRGGDPDLNRLKNRTSEPSRYILKSIDDLERERWPFSALDKPMSKWGPQDRSYLGVRNASAVTVEGYLIALERLPADPAGCNIDYPTERRVQLHLVANIFQGREDSLVAVVTPLIRATHREMRESSLTALVGKRVRIAGWFLFNPEHPEEVGKTRATLFEIHPVLVIEEVK